MWLLAGERPIHYHCRPLHPATHVSRNRKRGREGGEGERGWEREGEGDGVKRGESERGLGRERERGVNRGEDERG